MTMRGINWPMRMFWAVLVCCLVVLAPPARADTVQTHVDQLSKSTDYKVRLSAALWLARKSDVRAIAALSTALTGDVEHTVRQIAAKSLGSQVTPRTPADIRDRAVHALDQAARRDHHKAVREQAARSLKQLQALAEPVANDPGDGRIFINVGVPAVGSHSAPKGFERQLQSALREVVGRSASGAYFTEWPGQLPTKAQLRKRNVRAYYLGSKIDQLEVQTNGRQAEIACTVALHINGWEGRDGQQRWRANETAWATGSGRVTSGSSASAIDTAKVDCLLSVAEQITSKRLMPYLNKVASVASAR